MTLRALLNLRPVDPRLGLAIDEALLDTIRLGGEDALRLWVNDRCAVVGRSQSLAAEVDLHRAAACSVPALRRISGGGAVYHYPGNLNLSVILSDGASLGNVRDLFRRFGGCIAEALARWNVDVTVHEHTLCIGERKLAGAAQARRGRALLYHSTLLLEPDSGEMAALLRAMRTGYHSPGTPSQPRPTVSLAEICSRPPSREEVADALCRTVADHLNRTTVVGSLAGEARALSRRLATTKYGSDAWNAYR